MERLAALLAPRYVDPVWVADGGMGVVYAAHDTTLDRRVAVKVLAPELATASGTARFVREARILARLSHPHIVPIHEAREGDGLYVYIMAYVDGETLAARLSRGPLPAVAAKELAEHLLSALARAHREGVVHRDVKPGNIFCTPDGAMLADFGIAHWTTGGGGITRPGDRPGTPDYMAPEQFAAGEITARADVYSAARVLYQAATGRRWELAADPRAADWTGVPDSMIPGLARALEPAPAARWNDAAAFRDALSSSRPFLDGKVRRVAAALLIVAALGAAALAAANARRGVTPAATIADLALLPFEEGDSASLGRLIALHASLRLEWYPRWRMVPRVESFADWDRERSLRSRAAHSVRGSLSRGERGWVLTISVHGDSSGRLVNTFEVPGDPEDRVGWGRAVADSLVAQLFSSYLDEYRELEGGATESEPAALAYFRGTDAFRRDSLDAAARHYERALRLDPGFTQARWQLLLVRRWQREEVGPELAGLYSRYRDELPALYAAVTGAQLEPDLRVRMESLASVQRRHGTRALAQFVMADELFHRGPLAGVPLSRALPLLTDERFDADPFLDVASNSYHAVWGYIRLGDRAEARAALERLRTHTAGGADREARMREALLRLAYDLRFRPLIGRAKLWWLGRDPDAGTLEALARYVRVALAFDLPDAQLAFARVLQESAGSASHRRQAAIARAPALLMLGRIDAGLAALDSAASALGDDELTLQTSELRVLAEVLGLPRRPDVEERAAVTALGSMAEAGTQVGSRASWALAVRAIASHDTGAFVVRHAPVHADTSHGGRRLDLLLHALEVGRHSPDSALAISAPLFHTDSGGRLGSPFARAVFYLALSEWHRRDGKLDASDGALLWYENSDLGAGWLSGPLHAAEVDFVASVPARLRRATLALERGDTTAACAFLPRVRELWRAADSASRQLLVPVAGVRCR